MSKGTIYTSNLTPTSLTPHHSQGAGSIADHHYREVLRIQSFRLVSHVPRILLQGNPACPTHFPCLDGVMNDKDTKEWSQNIMLSQTAHFSIAFLSANL